MLQHFRLQLPFLAINTQMPNIPIHRASGKLRLPEAR